MKAVDGVNQQTILGACITLISAIIVVTLLLSEVVWFLKVDVVSRMQVDSTAHVESVILDFDIEFDTIHCNRIFFLQEVTRGNIHIHEPGVLTKIPIGESEVGCRMKGSAVLDKVGGNFRFGVDPLPKSNPDQLNNVGDLRHKITRIAFSPTQGSSAVDKLPESVTKFAGQNAGTSPDVGVYHYGIQVVPTQYKTIDGELSFANQHAVVDRVLTFDQLQMNDVVNGIHMRNFRGLIFTYDFHPVMLYMEERREHLVDFLSNLIGIVGGVIVVLSLFEGCLQQSTKAIIGKKD